MLLLPGTITSTYVYFSCSDTQCTVPTYPYPMGPGCPSGSSCLQWNSELPGYASATLSYSCKVPITYSCCSSGSGAYGDYCKGPTAFPLTGNSFVESSCRYKSNSSTSLQSPPPPYKSGPEVLTRTVTAFIAGFFLAMVASLTDVMMLPRHHYQT